MFSMSPRELKRMLKKMGIDVEEYGDVDRVEIFLKNKKLVITNPQVVAFKTGGQVAFQISGVVKEEEVSAQPAPQQPVAEEVKIPEEDIKFVMEQTGVSYEEARKALVNSKGDIIQAILAIKSAKG
ncbi:NagC family transcriptional regulator [Thermosphaera chiliense]|uniref:Nascent polypeptide-associated complex protein n=1 Tax=Thermosphaera chiliense TaxID=3402707 RepID=A0A7M1USL9_9CREN|nr:NagC family transcriptional regulator [Thermosphaera aggregans]